MKKIFLVVLIIWAFSPAYAQIGEKNFIDQHYIEVTGKAQMEVAPNEIYLKILVNEKDFKGKQDLKKIEEQMIKKLSGLGIDVSKQLAVKDMASNFQKYWLKRTGINTSREYQLKVTNAETAGEVIRELSTLGISDISIEKVENSDIQKYRTEVKVMAIKAAREKAVSLAGAIGQKIGQAIYIQEINNPVYNALRGQIRGVSSILVKGYGNAIKPEAEQPDIQFEKIKLEYSILVRFALE